MIEDGHYIEFESPECHILGIEPEQAIYPISDARKLHDEVVHRVDRVTDVIDLDIIRNLLKQLKAVEQPQKTLHVSDPQNGCPALSEDQFRMRTAFRRHDYWSNS